MPNQNKIGALWVREKDGKKYLAGEVNGQRIVVFPNGYKTEDKHPLYIIYFSEPPPGKEATKPDPKASKRPSAKTAKR